MVVLLSIVVQWSSLPIGLNIKCGRHGNFLLQVDQQQTTRFRWFIRSSMGEKVHEVEEDTTEAGKRNQKIWEVTDNKGSIIVSEA